MITRQAFEGKGEMTVETDYLKIRPNEDLVTTDRPVVIKQAPKTVIYATGMIYEKKKKTVTLLKRVRAHYEKPLVSSSPAQTKQSKQKKSKQKLSQQKKNNQVKTNLTQANTKNARIRRSYE